MIKVVVIDDEELQRQGLVSLTPWESLGCIVVGDAENADKGLELIRDLQPDIVIVDIKMPGMSGLELIAKACEEQVAEYIIISGYGEFEYAKKAIELGVCGYLLKPVDDDELANVIQQAVHRVEERLSIDRLRLEYENHQFSKTIYQHYGEGSKLDKYLTKSLAYIDENCQQNLTIKDVAAEIGISPSYLHKIYADKLRYSFNDYLTFSRIRRAIGYLDNEQCKIYEVAKNCGYRDTRYFSAVFKKIVGMTPTEYREGKKLK